MSAAPDRSNVVPFSAGAPAEPYDDGPALETYKRLFTESRDLSRLTRLQASEHRRYYDGDQWTDETRRLKERRKEPTFVINRVRPGVEGMVGVVEKGKSDPRAYPRNPQNNDAADVATDTLRYISDENRWHQSKLKCFRNILVEGTAAVLIEVDAKLDVKLRRIRYESFFYDPYSREPDFSDATYMGIADWRFLDQLITTYPEFTAQLTMLCTTGDVGDSIWDDRPRDGNLAWSDSKRRRLLIVEMYKLEAGTWLKCVFVGALKLEEGPSPYADNDGKPCCPIEAYSAFIDDQNRRYGVVKDMIGPQDEINVLRTKNAHLSTFRQLQESDPSSAGVDPDEARKEAARPDGVIPSGWQIVPSNDKFDMDLQLLAEAKAEIERVGPNPAILGRQGADSSGRASLIRQQAGLTELAHLFSGLEDFEQRVWIQAWARVRQWWTDPKYIRVTDDPDSVKFLQINEPVWGAPAPVIDPTTGMPQYDPTTRQIMMRPQFMGMRNAVAEMEVDIIIDSTPDTANVQQEQYDALVELAKIPGALGPNPGAILLEASSLPRKRQIMQALEAQQAQAQPGPPQAPPLTPEQQALTSLAMREKQANIEKTTAQGHEANARAAKLVVEAHGVATHTAVMPSKAAIEIATGAQALDQARQQQARDAWPSQPQGDV